MDSTIKAVVEAMSPYGPAWLIALTVIASIIFLLAKFVPTVQKIMVQKSEMDMREREAMIELENKREERKQEESRIEEQRNKERTEMEGRWLQAMEHSVNTQSVTNEAINGMNSSVKALVAMASSIQASIDKLSGSIETSRDGSREMSIKVDSIYDKVVKGD